MYVPDVVSRFLGWLSDRDETITFTGIVGLEVGQIIRIENGQGWLSGTFEVVRQLDATSFRVRRVGPRA